MLLWFEIETLDISQIWLQVLKYYDLCELNFHQ